MAGESSAGRKGYVQSEIDYLKGKTEILRVGEGNSMIFKADEPESPVINISLGLFRKKYDLKMEGPLKTNVLIAFLHDMGTDQVYGRQVKAPENWEEIRAKVVRGDSGESIETVVANMRSQYELSPDLTDEEPIQSVLALDAIFITCFIICVCFGRNDEMKLTSECLYRENDSVKSQLYNAIFKMENQIPLSLIRNVVSYMYRNKRRHIKSQTIRICFGMRDSYLKRFPSCVFHLPKFNSAQKTLAANFHSLEQDHDLLYSIAKAFRSKNSSKGRSCWATLGWSTRGSPAGDNNGSYNQLAGGPPEDIESQHCVPNCIYNLFCKEDIDMWEFQLTPIAEKTQVPTAENLYKMGIRFEGQKEFFPKLKRHTFLRWRATLFLPYIAYIGGDTKECWVNLLAWEYKYEHSLAHQGEKRRNVPFTQYLCFMKNLVYSEEDVKLLLKERNPVIGMADLGDHKQVAELFSSIVTTIFTRYDDDWRRLVKEIDDFHNNNPLRRPWVAFVDKYFDTPWFAITFVTSTIVAACTFYQTILSTARLFFP